ncbi:hypothetical protein [Humidesulfovibrio idahonensis]
MFQRVQAVPGKFVEAITERIESMDSHPGNLANAILASWRTIDKSAAANDDAKGCVNCDGDGTITGYRKNPKNGKIEIWACTCAHCYPHGQYSGTRQTMRAAGCMVCPSNDREEQSRWWHAYQKSHADSMKAKRAQGGNVVPGDLLENFDRMRTVVEQRDAA